MAAGGAHRSQSPLKQEATGDDGGPGQRGRESLRDPRVQTKPHRPGGNEASVRCGEVGRSPAVNCAGAAGTKVGRSLALRECPAAALVDTNPPGERESDIKAPVR
ncbi:hypothetical protein NDU88_010845 [Pleurodeles waltl]|uniref:Uncharacterized protein n=1 Tax=Pleurodeles waltl TaxID=8319 RepID=A0AAV7RZC9_PLEWA|nr:hypothetical protein NDU88_010845 [Pleurodeles waltl]